MPAEQPVTVLAVDDLQDNLDLICEVLEDEPYRVLTARSAEAAMHLAGEQRPDVAILDVQMPDLDGYALCHQLRALCGAPLLPVMFLTANRAATADVVHGLDVGGCDYITKPFHADELRARVRACLRIRNEQLEELASAKHIARRLSGR